MHHQKKYSVKNDDVFEPGKFALVNEEIILINDKTVALPVIFKASIIISFLKDHSLSNEWIKANPELTKSVTSGSLFTGAIESLFEACRTNILFQKQLETFLIAQFTATTVLS